MAAAAPGGDWGCMCGRCAPHGGFAPEYAGALGIGSKAPPTRQTTSKDAVHPPSQRHPAGVLLTEKTPSTHQASALKRGLGGSRNVHRRSEEPAPQEE